MGNYNAQYESYYSNIINKRKSKNYGVAHKETFRIDKNFFIKRISRDLVGVFALFIFILGTKIVSTPQTTLAYQYSKSILNENYDYMSALKSIKNLNAKSLEIKVTDLIDSAKSKIIGGKTLKEKLKTDFIAPVPGIVSITNAKSLNDGIDISTGKNTEILAVYDGKVKESGQDSKLGKYVIIDHGSGYETKYAYLSDTTLKKGDSVKKGEVIGKVVAAAGTNTSSLHFELSYMGESLNPKDYLSLGTN